MKKALFLLAAIATLPGCGDASEKSFNDSFDEKFGESCISSASKSGVPTDIATKICDCAIVKIDKKYSVTEKLRVSSEELNPIISECLSSVVPK